MNKKILTTAIIFSYVLTQPSPSFATEYNLFPTKDTTIKQEYPTRNYGDQRSAVASNYGSKNDAILLNFDLTQINYSITDAKLTFYPSLERSIDKRIALLSSSNWNESTVTWETSPGTTQVLAEFSLSTQLNNPTTITLDSNIVSSYVGKNLSIAIVNLEGTSNTLEINTKESEFGAPTLTINTSTSTPSSTPTPTPTPTPTSTPTPTPTSDPQEPTNTDINNDGTTDINDYNTIITQLDTNTPSSDINGNGTVDIFDINLVISSISSPTPTPSPTSQPTSDSPGSINLVYTQGGIWLTPEEIAQIPTNNASWDSLVSYANSPMNIVEEITWTAGGSGPSDTKTPQAMYARAVVGLRTNNQSMINELKSELDLVDDAINKAIDIDKNQDEKWAERNLGLIAVAANIIDYRPTELKTSLRKATQEALFDGNAGTIEYFALKQLPNKPAYGRWSLLTTAYLNEDWNTVNKVIKAHAKAMGEETWNGVKTDQIFELTGLGADDDWQTLHPGGKNDPLAIMPINIYYQDHGVGGLFLADQYRAEPGPVWPPSYTNYSYEGLASYNAVSWAAHHLGYQDVFSWGDYAILRSLLFALSDHDGKPSWEATGNDLWQIPAIMTWAYPEFGNTLPEYLYPESPSNVNWPISVPEDTRPGRGMGFMYATHYARLVK